MGFLDNLTGGGKRFSDSLRYVDDFRTEEATDARGRTRKKAVYIGPWMCVKTEARAARARMIASMGLGLLSVGALVGMLLQNHAGVDWLPVSLPKVAALFPSLYLWMGLLSLPLGNKPMRRDRYMHSMIRAMRSCVGLLALIGLAFLASFVYRMIDADWTFFGEDFLFVGLCVLSFLCSFGVIALLRSLDVEERPNASYTEEK